jgi:hypothetical protein
LSGDQLLAGLFPSQNQGEPSESAPCGTNGASHEVHRASEHCMSTGPRPTGSPQRRDEERFCPRRQLPDRPSPDPFGSGSFPRAFRPLRSSFSGAPRPDPARRDTRVSNHDRRPLLPRISSLIATSPAASTIPCPDTDTRGFQAPLRSVLGLSQPLDGFLRHRLRGLVSSRSHVQGSSPSRGFSRLAAGNGSSPPPASVPFGCAHSPASRLPCAPPSTSRRCSTNRCVPRIRRLNLLRGRSPLRVLSFPRDQLDHRVPRRIAEAIRS